MLFTKIYLGLIFLYVSSTLENRLDRIKELSFIEYGYQTGSTLYLLISFIIFRLSGIIILGCATKEADDTFKIWKQEHLIVKSRV